MEAHTIECKARKILVAWLAKHRRTFAKSDDPTFDLLVDGQYAEMKAKAHGWDRFDFVSLTAAQKRALGGKLKRIFIVLGVRKPKAEIIEISAEDLQRCRCCKIQHYEWNKGAIKHLRKNPTRAQPNDDPNRLGEEREG